MFELGKEICQLAEIEALFLAGLMEGQPNQTFEKEFNSNNTQSQNENLKPKEIEILTYDGKQITKTPNRNCWQIRFYKNGRQITVYGKTQKDVIQKYKKIKNEDINSISSDITLKEWFDKFITLYKSKNVKDTTIRATNIDFKNAQSLYNKPIKKINQFEVQHLINNISGNSSRLRTYTLLNALYEKALLNKLVDTNIMKLVEKPIYKAKENIALTNYEEQQFIEVCKNNKYGNFFLICLYQGLRKGECRALQVKDIDFENKTLTVDESLNPHTERTDTKNSQSNRIMPLFEKSIKVLKESIKNKKNNDYIFDIGINTVDRQLKTIIQESNIRKITTHNLRHTFITRCQENNIPLYVVQSWVGHEKGSVITTKIYTHLNKETNNKFVDIINNIKK